MIDLKKLLACVIALIMSERTFGQWEPLTFIGSDLTISAYCIDSNNNLILGGAFHLIDSNTYNSLAVWDSTNWSTFGNNDTIYGQVYAIKEFHGEIIIAGLFSQIGNVYVNNIAKWDGSTWSAMGSGFNNAVRALEIYNDSLYAGGDFYLSGIDTIRFISKWSGSNWTGIGELNGFVNSLCVHNNYLIAAGQFTRIDNQPFYRVAKYDGQNWSNSGSGFSDRVGTLKVLDDTLYAAGNFVPFAGLLPDKISKFGLDWEFITSPPASENYIADIEKIGGNLVYAAQDLHFYDGSTTTSQNVVGSVENLFKYKGQLYAIGGFYSIDSIRIGNIARFVNSSVNVATIEPFRQDYTAYPNPSNSILQFSGKACEFQEVSLFDFTGRLILSAENSSEIDVSKIPSGAYIAMIICDEYEIPIKLFIQH
jgi:hypothetical protein